MKSREHVVANGKAAFYASIWDDLRNAAMDNGWALGLHGSLANDMDIMAMPWVEDAKPVEEMIKALSDCFTESIFKEHHLVPDTAKPNGRTVYTMTIWADFHLDINIIQPAQPSPLSREQAGKLERRFVIGFKVMNNKQYCLYDDGTWELKNQ